MSLYHAALRRRNSFLLVLTAWIWGIAFVAQSAGGDAVGPYTFNCIRCIIGGFVLMPVIKLLGRLYPERRNNPRTGQGQRVSG